MTKPPPGPPRPPLPAVAMTEKAPSHPGLRLRELMSAYAVTITQVAEITGLEKQWLLKFMRAACRCTPEPALLLGRLFNEKPESWASQQAEYEVYKAKLRLGRPTFPPLTRPAIKHYGPSDACVCGHWEWEHLNECVAQDGYKPCVCRIYIRWGGYLAAMGAENGLPAEVRDEALNAAKRLADENDD